MIIQILDTDSFSEAVAVPDSQDCIRTQQLNDVRLSPDNVYSTLTYDDLSPAVKIGDSK